MAKRRQEYFSRRARREGRLARSIYKLEEIDRRWRILRRGDVVLDLGCAPGSWLAYAGERVGPEGEVIGYDLEPVDASFPSHVHVRTRDAFTISDSELPECIDVVLSDMAPKTTGHRVTDASRSAALAERALAVAEAKLRTGGHVVVKVLEGGDVPAMVKAMRATYRKVEQLRPRATRKHSTEIFLIGLAKKV
jgi:23S rRNA (uridine2552-2'-O)-methyltransferase